jgi:hypothetical protein
MKRWYTISEMNKQLLIIIVLFVLVGCSTHDKRLTQYPPYPPAQGESDKIAEEELKEEELKAEEEIEYRRFVVSRVVDRLCCLINERQFDKAIEEYDKEKHLLESYTDQEKEHPNPQIGRLYGKWFEGIKQVRQILGNKDMTPEQKRQKALEALVTAQEHKRQAALLKMME